MKKHELLVPAGNMECLYQAVQNGCDAVYIACKTFGARKFAQNFSNEEIVEAIKYCHLYGVKVYVTMNTLVKNNEVDVLMWKHAQNMLLNPKNKLQNSRHNGIPFIKRRKVICL